MAVATRVPCNLPSQALCRIRFGRMKRTKAFISVFNSADHRITRQMEIA